LHCTPPSQSGATLLTQLKSLLLPAMALVMVLFGYIARIARAGTIEALDADYTRTAYLKRLPTSTPSRPHAPPHDRGPRRGLPAPRLPQGPSALDRDPAPRPPELAAPDDRGHRRSDRL